MTLRSVEDRHVRDILHFWSLKNPFSDEELSAVGIFTYLGSRISTGDCKWDELTSLLRRVRLKFTNLSHPWRPCDIRPSIGC